MWNFPLLPERASTVAPTVDAIFWLLTLAKRRIRRGRGHRGRSSFAVKYRRGSKANRANPIHSSLKLELSWSIIPFILGIGRVLLVHGGLLYAVPHSDPHGYLM